MLHVKMDKVALMTMHASKGMEFPVVFICGCEDGIIPYRKPGEEDRNMAEERRLFYVAMTRAREKLCCTWTLRREMYGKMCHNRISPFVEDMDPSIVNHRLFQKPEKKKTRQNQMALF